MTMKTIEIEHLQAVTGGISSKSPPPPKPLTPAEKNATLDAAFQILMNKRFGE
jgi:hypothetical protein